MVAGLFPYGSFLPYQDGILHQIEQAFDSGIRLILVDAPTGFGKSGINTTICRSVESAYYLTPLKKLQTQILNDPALSKFYVEIRGRSNYKCLESSDGKIQYSCAEGACQCKKGYQCSVRDSDDCEYWNAKLSAIQSPRVLSNFAYFMSEGMLPRSDYTLQWERDLVVVDEMDDDSHIVRFVSTALSNQSLGSAVYGVVEETIGFPEGAGLDLDWLGLVYRVIKNRAGELGEVDDISVNEIREKNKLVLATNKIVKLLRSHKRGDEWVMSVDRNMSKAKKKVMIRVEYAPIYAHKFAQELLWDRADKFVVSSATILNPIDFCKRTGWAEEYEYVQVPSSFPSKNRPFVDATIGKMTHKNRDNVLGDAVRMLECILDIEIENRGIVHTTSYNNVFAIQNMIDQKYISRLLFTEPHSTQANDEMLQDWIDTWYEGDKSVIVAPAMTRGLDLKDDLARFGVLFKVGYPNISDKRIARKLELGRWDEYYMDAARDIVQAAGRHIRSPEDYGRFYIIDTSVQDVINRVALPEWFKEPDVVSIQDLLLKKAAVVA